MISTKINRKYVLKIFKIIFVQIGLLFNDDLVNRELGNFTSWLLARALESFSQIELPDISDESDYKGKNRVHE